jgi:hypothetical protein
VPPDNSKQTHTPHTNQPPPKPRKKKEKNKEEPSSPKTEEKQRKLDHDLWQAARDHSESLLPDTSTIPLQTLWSDAQKGRHGWKNFQSEATSDGFEFWFNVEGWVFHGEFTYDANSRDKLWGPLTNAFWTYTVPDPSLKEN